MKPETLSELLGEIAKARVAVLGDFCLDVYFHLDLSRSEHSVETGAPTLPVRQFKTAPGGAGNLAANIAALGASATRCFGIVGTDPWAAPLRTGLADAGISTEGLLACDGVATLAYAKTYEGERENSRHDFGNFNRISDGDADRVLAALERAIAQIAAVAVNEQVPEGIHTPHFREGLAALMQRHPAVPFVVDSRNHAAAYPGAMLKLNDHEAMRLCGKAGGGIGNPARREILEAAAMLFQQRGKAVFITRGDRGMVVCDGQGVHEIPAVKAPGKVDTVGAGDSALAGIGCGLASGAGAVDAAWLGTFCAGVTVRKLRQTGTATAKEVMDLCREAVYDRNIDLAEDTRLARWVPHTDIECIEEVPASFRPACAIFDHDGTLSTLREGWEKVMEPVMIRAILGSRLETADAGVVEKVRRRVIEFIDRTTGIQTLKQMQGLVDLVNEFGYVPPQEVLDIHGYKALYNLELMKQVETWTLRLRRGELSVEDFSIKQAGPFLKALHGFGVKLHLASGTDEADVREEARLMGYAELFEGRIHGANGDVNQEAKRAVLERLFRELGPEGARRVVVFGDGPVEMREARRFGALAVGVVSDEVRRYGVNPEKRARLVRAGAQLLIPDYSRMDAILDLLHLGGNP